jgi:uncharacterized membrane protein (UPF0127 family)
MAAKEVMIIGADGRLVCSAAVADNPLARLCGLLGRASLPAGEGLLIRPAPSIHTFFMRFAIDAVFLDADCRVLAVERSLGPWRVAVRRGARAVLELAAGDAARGRLRAGETLRLADVRGGNGYAR